MKTEIFCLIVLATAFALSPAFCVAQSRQVEFTSAQLDLMTRQARSLFAKGKKNEAFALYEKSISTGDAVALYNYASFLDGQKEVEKRKQLLRISSGVGFRSATIELAKFAASGDKDVQFWRYHAALDSPDDRSYALTEMTKIARAANDEEKLIIVIRNWNDECSKRPQKTCSELPNNELDRMRMALSPLAQKALSHKQTF